MTRNFRNMFWAALVALAFLARFAGDAGADETAPVDLHEIEFQGDPLCRAVWNKAIQEIASGNADRIRKAAADTAPLEDDDDAACRDAARFSAAYAQQLP